jgi:dTDP-4-amino-4,6-dideoxygalactose transaminase
MEIRFNVPACVGGEIDNIKAAIKSGRLSGDNHYTKDCERWFKNHLGSNEALLTPSCTHALEMAALLLNIQPGDEVIMPSYTFVSTANAFVLRGATIVFVDIRPDTMNIDEKLIESAITERTKAIVPVHYAGVVCEMDVIVDIGKKYNIPIVEDAAQAITSTYNGEIAGSHGAMSAFSFHETKNLTAGGEGGLLAINDEQYSERAVILREKGTNRTKFFKGEVDKYTWVDVGSSYLPSEIQAAYLSAQLDEIEKIQQSRLSIWDQYFEAIAPLQESGRLELQKIPSNCQHNAHMFYIKLKDLRDRDGVLARLNKSGVKSVFHYIPLHSTDFGKSISRFHGKDKFTTSESERLIRLPVWYGMDSATVNTVVEKFYEVLR